MSYEVNIRDQHLTRHCKLSSYPNVVDNNNIEKSEDMANDKQPPITLQTHLYDLKRIIIKLTLHYFLMLSLLEVTESQGHILILTPVGLKWRDVLVTRYHLYYSYY